MLTLYAKNEADSIPGHGLKKIKEAPRRNVGLEILEGLRQLKRGEHGRISTLPSVATVREGTGLSQPRFTQLLGVSVRTLQEWELPALVLTGLAPWRAHWTGRR
jgi:DNA-binding transcriptional regulator YiaG